MSLCHVTAAPISLDDFRTQALACGMTETHATDDGSPILVGAESDHAFYDIREEMLADGETHVAFVMRGYPFTGTFFAKVACHNENQDEYYRLHCFGPLPEPSRGILLDALVTEFGIDRQIFADALDGDEQAVLVHGLELVPGGFAITYHAPSQNLNVYVEDCQSILLEVDAGARSIPPIGACGIDGCDCEDGEMPDFLDPGPYSDLDAAAIANVVADNDWIVSASTAIVLGEPTLRIVLETGDGEIASYAHPCVETLEEALESVREGRELGGRPDAGQVDAAIAHADAAGVDVVAYAIDRNVVTILLQHRTTYDHQEVAIGRTDPTGDVDRAIEALVLQSRQAA